MKKTNYFSVICKCGHVGRTKYVPIEFPVKASDGKQAARIVRQYPRVKRNHKNCIIMVRRITELEYQQLRNINNNDKYLLCHSSKDQRQIDMTERIFDDLQNLIETDNKNSEEGRKHPLKIGKTIIKNPRKYGRLYGFGV